MMGGRRRPGLRTAVALVISASMLWGCTATQRNEERRSAAETVREFHGDLLEMIHNFASQMPGRDSGGYDRPDAAQRAGMASVFSAMRAGEVGRASELARPYDYSVVRYTDAATDTPLLVLAEHQEPDGSWPHAWGLYVHSPTSDSSVVVEIPHPVADVNTEVVGVQLFRILGASDLLVAGADRDANADGSADVAHVPGSVFGAVHQTTLHTRSVVVQVHGFDQSEHAEALGDVVVSSGVAPPDPVAVRVAHALDAVGIRTCLYDGIHCRALGATTNIQGVSTRTADATFLHLELSTDLRDRQDRSTRFVDAVARVLG